MAVIASAVLIAAPRADCCAPESPLQVLPSWGHFGLYPGVIQSYLITPLAVQMLLKQISHTAQLKVTKVLTDTTHDSAVLPSLD